MQSINSWWWVYRFPLDSAKIATYLKETLQCNVKHLDLQAQNKITLHDTLASYKPELVIISTWFPSMQYDAATAAQVKKLSPNTHVSSFGIPPTLLADSFLESDTRWFDVPFDTAIIWDPKVAYWDIVQNLDRKWMIHTVPTRDREGKIDRSLIDNTLYRSPVNGGKMTYLEASVWCPRKCNFCVIPEYFGGKFIFRSVDDIVAEFEDAIVNHNIWHISLRDEWTTFSRKSLLELCDKLIELRAKAPKGSLLSKFIRNTRSTTDLLDEEVVAKLEQSGLVSITMWLESMDDAVLSQTGKKTSVANGERAVELLSKSSIISIGHFVFGLPGDTIQSAEHTMERAARSKLDAAQFYCSIPYPWTGLYDMAKANGRIEVEDLTKYELSNPIMGNENMTAKQVWDMRSKAMKHFYLRKWFPLAKKMLKHADVIWLLTRWMDFSKRVFHK